ncbi:MAG: DUF2161 family putative PD-(D/E)XK-type phosphodiesterase [Bacillota bacterium]
MVNAKWRETDLHQPVSDFLTAQGYTVRSEVNGCDMVAVKGDEVIALEFKLHFNASLLVQAAIRQRATASVYVVLPRPKKGMRSREWQGQRLLLRRLELGLIFVALGPHPRAEVVFHPQSFALRRRKHDYDSIIREVQSRSADYNQGGSSKRKLVTGYRENAIQIATVLQLYGALSTRRLRALGTGAKTTSILSRNVYGWFERVSRGVYGLTPQGRLELLDYPELVQHYIGDAPASSSVTE